MALKERNEKDLTQYNMEYKELMRIIDHDAKLKLFMNVKAQERSELEEEEAAKRKAGNNIYRQYKVVKFMSYAMLCYAEIVIISVLCEVMRFIDCLASSPCNTYFWSVV